MMLSNFELAFSTSSISVFIFLHKDKTHVNHLPYSDFSQKRNIAIPHKHYPTLRVEDT